MATIDERIERMARGEYERTHNKGEPTWEDLSFDQRAVYLNWSKLNAADFLMGDKVVPADVTLYVECPAGCGKLLPGRRMQRDFCPACDSLGVVEVVSDGDE